jgi:acetyl esterase/lipase
MKRVLCCLIINVKLVYTYFTAMSTLSRIGTLKQDPFIVRPHSSSSVVYGSEDSDDMFYKVPVSVQHYARDQGIARFIMDTSVTFGVIPLVASDPPQLSRFIAAGNDMKSFRYGQLKEQNLQVYTSDISSTTAPSVLILVHGGAWGSGKPWMYRLMAIGMMKTMNASAAIVIQYPVYPTHRIPAQAESIYEAIKYIRREEIFLGLPKEATYAFAGHSSGANVCALALIKCMEREEKLIDCFLSLNGVYDIRKHYSFEKSRGVHEISPMEPAANNRENWDESSPTLILPKISKEKITKYWPNTLFFHGQSDTVVPYSSSVELAAELFNQGAIVETSYPIISAHADCIFEFSSNDTTNSLIPQIISKYFQNFMALNSSIVDKNKDLEMLSIPRSRL